MPRNTTPFFFRNLSEDKGQTMDIMKLAPESAQIGGRDVEMVTESAHRTASVSKTKRKPIYEFFKRILDILIALAAFVIGSPIYLWVVMKMRKHDPGPIFYYHTRLGRNGKEFKCYKFRTMVPDAEDILKKRPELMKEFTEGYKLKNDPRITPLGQYLRKTSLDELPQFYNILRGEMSFIGPRPVVPPEIERYGTHAKKLLSVKPGLSGMWQAYGRSSTTYQERIELDMIYIDHRSLLLDAKLIYMTILAVLAKRGAC